MIDRVRSHKSLRPSARRFVAVACAPWVIVALDGSGDLWAYSENERLWQRWASPAVSPAPRFVDLAVSSAPGGNGPWTALAVDENGGVWRRVLAAVGWGPAGVWRRWERIAEHCDNVDELGDPVDLAQAESGGA